MTSSDKILPMRLGPATRAAAILALVAALAASLLGETIRTAEATPSESNESSKSYEEFIDAVWAFESDIDPSQQNYYNDNWNKPVITEYPKVEHPGRVVRDANGDPVMGHDITIEEFFNIIGIGDLYHPSDTNPNWKLIQSNVINYLGFVGFQFQESDLVDLGYYRFERILVPWFSYPVHYIDVPNHYWANGVRNFMALPPLADVPTWARDVVIFRDPFFTGKNGIYNYADFTNPDKHVLVIKDHFTNKYNGIVARLKERGRTLDDYLGTSVYWDKLDPPVSPPPGGRANQVHITLSGLLAGAHLRGAAGVVSMLVDRKNPADESGTHILQYVQDYAGYNTPFSNNTTRSPISTPRRIPRK